MNVDADRAVEDQARRNLRAFLMMVRACEGTADDDGYFALFGHTPSAPRLFVSTADHPRLRTYETHDEFIRNGSIDYTTAAGAFQITESTWDRFTAARGGKCPFDQAGQDECAAWLIDRAGALGDIFVGRLSDALIKCRGIWASLPTATVGQPKRTAAFASSAYVNAGGALA